MSFNKNVYFQGDETCTDESESDDDSNFDNGSRLDICSEVLVTNSKLVKLAKKS